MIKQTLSALIGLTMGVVASQGAAQAQQVVTFDFTDTPFDSVAGKASESYSIGLLDFTITALPSGSRLTFNDGVGEAPGPVSGGGFSLAGNGDGIGIGFNDDEVTEGREQLLITFDNRTVELQSVAFLDLFAFNNTEKVDLEVSFSNAASQTFSFTATALDGIGFGAFNLPAGLKNVTSLLFTAPTPANNDDNDNDFAVAGIVVAVPEPATWLMMLFGFALTASALRRRARAASVFA